MKSYLVLYKTERGERGSLGNGAGTYEACTVVRHRTNKIARAKIFAEYGSEGVQVYCLTKRLRLKVKRETP